MPLVPDLSLMSIVRSDFASDNFQDRGGAV